MSTEKVTSTEEQISREVESSTPEREDQPQELGNLSLSAKIIIALKTITIEPLVTCYLAPTVLLMYSNMNLTLEKACRVNLGFDKDACDALISGNQSYPGYKDMEQSIQTLAANMSILKNVIQGVITALLLLFLGSWSDRHKKRKPLLLNPIFGQIAACIGLLLSMYFYLELPVVFNVLAEAIPFALTGGLLSVNVGAYSYVSEVSTPESRTTRIGHVQIATSVSLCVGIALSGVLLDRTGVSGVLFTCLALYFCGYLYGFCFVKDIWEYETEVVQADEIEPRQSFLADFFDTKHVVDTCRIAFIKGPRNRRERICWLLVLTVLLSGPVTGESNVAYYYVRYKFGWNAVESSIFSTFNFIAQTLGTMFSLAFFGTYLKADDSVLGIISTGSKILAAFFYAFGPTPTYYCLGALIEVLNTTSVVAMRSIISKLVTADELGKVNSIACFFEALVPLVYGTLYSTVYAATLKFFPGAFYMTGAALTVPAVSIFIWLYMEHRRDEKEAQNQIQEGDHNSDQQLIDT